MIQKISGAYKSIAIFLLNTLLLLLLINTGLYFFYRYKDHSLQKTNPIAQKYGMEKLKKVYKGKNESEIDALLTETWNRPQQHMSFTGFKERPFKGKYVNVDSSGIRLTPGAPALPPDSGSFDIFIFGGSTTFGYGVADNETIPYYLQQLLRDSLKHKNIHCYNFGSGFYYSVQERILFEELLLKGIVPDAAIFIDGLNDFYFTEPFYAKEERKYFEHKSSSLFSEWIQSLPMSRLAKSVSYRLFGTSSDYYDLNENCETVYLQGVVKRYFENKKLTDAIAEKYGIPTFFIWQPVSCYHYEPGERLFFEEEDTTCSPRCGYEQMARFLSASDVPENFYWLADIQSKTRENLYVDRNHYSPEMNKRIAEEIFHKIKPGLDQKNPFSWIPSAIRENIKNRLRGVFQN